MQTTQQASQIGLASIPAAAAFLSVSRSKLYSMMNAGQCPSRRFGKSVRIPWVWLIQQASVDADHGHEIV